MALTSSDVLASLDGVSSPDGRRCRRPASLSDIVVADGKVFFSITVDAAVVQAWEPVRKRAEAAVRAVPGVTSVMVALTAERKAGAARRPPPPRRPRRPRRSGRRAAPQRRPAIPGVERHHRGRLRQGRRRQVDDRGQSRARPARPRPQGRRARCRHLRPVDAEAARHQGTAADHRRHDARSRWTATASRSCRSAS